MTHGRTRPKRKRISPDLPPPTVPTLKEYMWGELTLIIKRLSTVPLTHEKHLSMAMKKFRLRVGYEWQELVDRLDMGPSPGAMVQSEELNRVALTVAYALANPHKTEWDVTRFADRVKNTRPTTNDHSLEDARLQKFFKNPEFGNFNDPATILDCHGRIIMWFLPRILSPYRVDDLNTATTSVRKPLNEMMNSLTNAEATGWRSSLFCAPLGGGRFGTGVLNMSPGWFQRVHDQIKDLLYVSSNVKTETAAAFLQLTSTHNIICNALTSLVAPQLYDIGLHAIQLIKDGQSLHQTHQNLHLWTSVWSGFALIVNRKTPFHRDQGGAPPDYDLLVSSGTHTSCVLEVRDLGLTANYVPGTAVAISGKVLRHGVSTWHGGERICQAHFIKDAVHDRLGLPRPDWVLYDTYLGLAHAD